MSKSISLEEILERIYNTHKDKITLLYYCGKINIQESLFKCNICGYEWYTSANAVARGNGCFACAHIESADRERLSINDVRKEIESQGCELISTEYKNTKEKLEIRFECGHVWKMCLDAFRQGQRCKQCSQIKKNLAKRVDESVFQEIIIKNKLTFISFPNGYINRNSYIEYYCKNHHYNKIKIREFLEEKLCKECMKENLSYNQRGSKGSGWKGGRNLLRQCLIGKLVQWKKDSAKSCNYKCVITGERFNDIHHLYSFNSIVQDALNELGLEKYEFIGEYTDEELSPIIDKVIEIHARYPLGVCLRRDIHKLFHKLYGLENNFPEQFYEFASRIKSGEIKIQNIERK